MKFPSYYIYVLPNQETPVAEFDSTVVNLDVIITCALHIGDQFQHKVTFATDVAVVDATTGEVVWNYRDNVADGWQVDNETYAEWEEEEEDDAEWEEDNAEEEARRNNEKYGCNNCDICPYADECIGSHLFSNEGE